MAESKTARASMRAGAVMAVKADPFDTPEKKIRELRKQREAGLFVNRMDFVDALLESYDGLKSAYEQTKQELEDANQALSSAVEEQKEKGSERDLLET